MCGYKTLIGMTLYGYRTIEHVLSFWSGRLNSTLAILKKSLLTRETNKIECDIISKCYRIIYMEMSKDKLNQNMKYILFIFLIYTWGRASYPTSCYWTQVT